ncbi:MAG: inositol monophosphatase family protein [Propionibacteriaceae bacterium]
MRTNDISELLREVTATVIRPRFKALADDDIIHKRPDDLVTVADREAEEVIAKRLQTVYPRALIVGEENAFEYPELLDGLAEAEQAFVIDPVDGTRNFVNGNDNYAVMLAELRQGIPVRSWILHPEQDNLYVAERGAGVWRDGVRINPIARTAPYDGAASRAKFVGKDSHDVKSIWPSAWCCGFDYTHILEGHTDFTIYRHAKPWDHLPGKLMLHEVGGKIYTADGGQVGTKIHDSGLVAVANDEIWRAVAPLLRALCLKNPK